MKNFDDLKVGDKLVCVNSEGWGCFKKGEVYTFTELWGAWDSNIDLDRLPVACESEEILNFMRSSNEY